MWMVNSLLRFFPSFFARLCPLGRRMVALSKSKQPHLLLPCFSSACSWASPSSLVSATEPNPPGSGELGEAGASELQSSLIYMALLFVSGPPFVLEWAETPSSTHHSSCFSACLCLGSEREGRDKVSGRRRRRRANRGWGQQTELTRDQSDILMEVNTMCTFPQLDGGLQVY